LYWQAISAQARINAEKNLHPHRLGLGGYNTAEKKWKESGVVSSSSSSSGITSKTDIRSFRLCMARAKPTAEGTYEILNPATKEVLQRAVYLKNH
jgi:hypothetical protein